MDFVTCSTTDSDVSSIIDTVWTMRRQEETTYRPSHDYLRGETLSAQRPNTQQQTTSLANNSPIDSECRSRMVEWCYQIIDFCDFKRETVAVAMSCLDRFLCSSAGYEIRQDRSLFQLAAMSALYTSVKIHEPEAMDPTVVAGLSRGAFTKEQVEAMEFKMLNSIQWRVNPPTALAFLDQFLSLVPSEILREDERDGIVELAAFQTELAVSDPYFMRVNASTIALAALLNACNSMNIEYHHLSQIQRVLSDVSNTNSQTFLFRDIQLRLFNAMTGQSRKRSSVAPRYESHPVNTQPASKVQDSSRPVSPRSVAVAP